MIQALIPLLGTIFDKVIPDPQAAAADAKLRVLELTQKGELAALDADLIFLHRYRGAEPG